MASVRASVLMFRMPGFPLISEGVAELVDQSIRATEEADDPVAVALDLADVIEVVAQQLRDLGADVYMERLGEAS